MATRTPLAPSHGAGGVFCVEALGRTRGGRRPIAGQHEPLRHTARNDGTDRLHRGDTRADGHAWPTDGAGGARKKAATGRRKPAAFVPKRPAFFVAAGARRQKAEKQRETTDAITERTKTLTSRHRIISKNTFSHRALPGKCRPKFARFVGLRGNRGTEYSFYFKASRTKNKKRIDNAQEDAPQIVHFHASPHSLCPIIQRLPAPTLKINALSFRFVGHNGQKTLASGAQFPVFCASLTTKTGYFPSEGR